MELTPLERFEALSSIRERQCNLIKERNAARESFADGNPHGYDEDYLKFLGKKIDTCENIIKKLGGV